ncbi:MAG: carboxypeptidase-like regulatory domain-containing protein [Bacteroidetes bacterium]|nr:carboxypeptidase-like regulatory domain-containing protein [Bacteroidota bacterium]
MKAFKLARYKAYSIALAYLKDNESVTGTLPLFTTVYNKAKALIDEIGNAENRRAVNLRTASGSKQQQHNELARLSLVYAAMLVGYAKDKGDTALAEAMAFNTSDLKHATPHELSTRAANVLEKLNALQTPLQEYGLAAEQVTEFANMLSQYGTGKNAPRSLIAERKQAGILVEENMAQLADIFSNELDSLMLYFRDTHPELYNQYIIKRTVVRPGRRKTRVEGVLTDEATGAALEGVSVYIKGTELSTITEEDGGYYLNTPSIQQGVLVFEKEGYQTKELKLKIKRGQALEQNMALVK